MFVIWAFLTYLWSIKKTDPGLAEPEIGSSLKEYIICSDMKKEGMI